MVMMVDDEKEERSSGYQVWYIIPYNPNSHWCPDEYIYKWGRGCYPPKKLTFLIRNLLTCLQNPTSSCLLLSILPSHIPSKIYYFRPGRCYTSCPYPRSLLTILPLHHGVWFSPPPLSVNSMQRASNSVAMTNVTPT